jgi:outer membrane protein assembly factor BamD (BamD/ComL family)
MPIKFTGLTVAILMFAAPLASAQQAPGEEGSLRLQRGATPMAPQAMVPDNPFAVPPPSWDVPARSPAAGASERPSAPLPAAMPANQPPVTSEQPPVLQGHAGVNVWVPGKILTGQLGEISLNPTCNPEVAAQQVRAYPQSPEAAFIYAVALTKTTFVELAVTEVKRARKLAQQTGDPNYFDRAVKEYEMTLQAYPNDDCIRYALAWAYYMQAYLYAEQAHRVERTQQQMAGTYRRNSTAQQLLKGAEVVSSLLTGSRPDIMAVPHIPNALDKAPSWAVPKVKMYEQKSLALMDELIKRHPQDVWAQVYKIHLTEEFTGDYQTALSQLEKLKKLHPNNPAVNFFLADAHTRNGQFGKGLADYGRALEERMKQ